LRPSADAGNALYIGTDGGLGGVKLPAGQYGNILTTVDNSWATVASGATYYYSLPQLTNTTTTVSTTAYFQPFMLTRSGVFTAAYANIVSANNTGGWTWYNTVYASDATTGLPAGKVTDLFRFGAAGTSNNAVLAATVTDTTTTFTGQTLYWLASWSVTAANYPTSTFRTADSRLSTRVHATGTGYPSGTYPTQGYIGYAVPNWGANTAGPASVAASFVTGNLTTYASTSVPSFWFGIKNV
jgi:hypothetical protein